MWDIIMAGGIVFTVPLLLLLLTIVGLLGAAARDHLRGGGSDRRRLRAALHLGAFSAVWGILGQTIGLYEAMTVIEAVDGVAPSMLAGGLRVSSISTILGLVNLAVALAGWTTLRYLGDRSE